MTELPLWLDDQRLAAHSWGSGPAVLLVHGWSGASTQLGGFVAPLVGRGFRVIAVDMPAHGQTAGKRANLGLFIRVIRQVASAAGGLYGIIGHSLGATAAALSEARGLALGRLVLLAPMPSFDFAVAQFAHALQLAESVQERVARLVEERIGLRREQADLMALPSPKAKTLLIHDSDDRAIGVQPSRDLARHWPDAQFWETAGLGHQRLLSDPNLIDRVVGFVGERPRPEGSRLDVDLSLLPDFRF